MRAVKINWDKVEDILYPLFLIFLVLRLTGNIDWSWWLVFSPMIGAFIIRTPNRKTNT